MGGGEGVEGHWKITLSMKGCFRHQPHGNQYGSDDHDDVGLYAAFYRVSEDENVWSSTGDFPI